MFNVPGASRNQLTNSLNMLHSITTLLSIVSIVHGAAKIPIKPLTNVNINEKTGYFSDPFHVPFEHASKVYISGTTHSYLECDKPLTPGGCSAKEIKFAYGESIKDKAQAAKATICGAAGIHPFQNKKGSWDAVATLHVQNTTHCEGISGWSVIVHAHPNDDLNPPSSWTADEILVGSFREHADANYDGKYFKTPAGQLYLIYQKQKSKHPKRDGVVAQAMSNPKTLTGDVNWLLLPEDDLDSEYYVAGKDFRLIETGNIRAIKDKFVMAYSVGAYNHDSYKIGIAYSDNLLNGWRKVMHENPDHLWGTNGPEVYYLLQAQHRHKGWHYVGNQVLAPGVPTVAHIGDEWVLLFAGYDPQDAQKKDNKYIASHRRPYFIKLKVDVPKDKSVKDANDSELQNWIAPA
jgi:hypothetical protein